MFNASILYIKCNFTNYRYIFCPFLTFTNFPYCILLFSFSCLYRLYVRTVVLANEVVPNPEDVLVFFTQSLRGRPAIMANGVRFLIMSENKKKILWRCSSMATKKIKCPARITMLKETPPKFIINKAEHVHAELKRNKYGSTKHSMYAVATTKVKSENLEYDGTINYQVIGNATATTHDVQEEIHTTQHQHLHQHHQHQHQHHSQHQ